MLYNDTYRLTPYSKEKTLGGVEGNILFKLNCFNCHFLCFAANDSSFTKIPSLLEYKKVSFENTALLYKTHIYKHSMSNCSFIPRKKTP